MEDALTEFVAFIALALMALFGHVGLWSIISGLISAIVTGFVFVVVFVLAWIIARNHRFGRWPRRIAKIVLVVQSVFVSLIIAGVVSAVCEIYWSLEPNYTLPLPWIGGFILMAWWISKLGGGATPRRDPEGPVVKQGSVDPQPKRKP